MALIKSNSFSGEKLLEITRAPGSQYILVNDKQTINEYYVGYADLKTKTQVTPETTFNNFSVTKTVTAAAVMQLVEQKKINLSDFVNPLFNEFHFQYPFTVQQLITHQAGFGDPIPISWIHLANEENSFDENNFILTTIYKNSKQKYVPGTKFKYSSIGFLLLSQIIEKVSFGSYQAYIYKNILANTIQNGTLGFTIKKESLHATGYHPRYSFSNILLTFFLNRKKFIKYNSGSWMAFENFYVNGKAYGGFIGNVRGLSSYLQLYLSNRIFKNSVTQQLMFTEQLGGMSFGWFTGKLNNNSYVCHAGGGGGYYCEIRIYPELKLASALIRNRSSFRDLRLLDKIDLNFIS